jgi:hypothetical protein
MTFDPVIQRYMSHFYDVHGNLHITIRPDLTKALGWANPKEKNDEPYLESSQDLCLDINYSGEIGDFNTDCDIVITTKAKAQGVQEDESQS